MGTSEPAVIERFQRDKSKELFKFIFKVTSQIKVRPKGFKLIKQSRIMRHRGIGDHTMVSCVSKLSQIIHKWGVRVKLVLNTGEGKGHVTKVNAEFSTYFCKFNAMQMLNSM